MAQRRKQYLNEDDHANVARDLALSIGDANHAIAALAKDNTSELRKCFMLLASRANYSFANYDNLKLTPITPKEQKLLKQFGFLPKGDDDHDFLDYEQIVEGFGETNDDRIERITYSVNGNCWYAVITHTDEDGNVWYAVNTKDYPTLKRVLEEIFEERKRAPKEKVTA